MNNTGYGKSNTNFCFEASGKNPLGSVTTSYLYKNTYGCVVTEQNIGGQKLRVLSVCDREGHPFPSKQDYAEILEFFDMGGYDETFDVPHRVGKSRYFMKKIA